MKTYIVGFILVFIGIFLSTQIGVTAERLDYRYPSFKDPWFPENVKMSGAGGDLSVLSVRFTNRFSVNPDIIPQAPIVKINELVVAVKFNFAF